MRFGDFSKRRGVRCVQARHKNMKVQTLAAPPTTKLKQGMLVCAPVITRA